MAGWRAVPGASFRINEGPCVKARNARARLGKFDERLGSARIGLVSSRELKKTFSELITTITSFGGNVPTFWCQNPQVARFSSE